MTTRSQSSNSSFPRLATDLRSVQESIVDSITVGDDRARGPFEHFTRRPGRLFRPTLTLTSSYVVEPQIATDQAVRAATIVELLHIATLCHDDLCDNAQTRRGQPTINAVFGNTTALISGDYLLACATSLAATLGTVSMRIVGETLKTVCLGQLQEGLDLYDVDRTEDAYFSCIAGKTAALMEAAAMLGVAAAGGDAATRSGMGSYGRNLGIAFQIWDDVLDIWAPGETTGKETGQDLANGVYTLPVIYALQETPRGVGAAAGGGRVHAAAALGDPRGARSDRCRRTRHAGGQGARRTGADRRDGAIRCRTGRGRSAALGGSQPHAGDRSTDPRACRVRGGLTGEETSARVTARRPPRPACGPGRRGRRRSCARRPCCRRPRRAGPSEAAAPRPWCRAVP